ncbi:hypothetical protein EGW08_011558 [Elysia chlorotica]|uniref:Uncharacterized protein n=1 Tax=Elysia chlorotica TaxID=188477 RepID=A0A3S1C1Y5_ELYCH|nr:hypothetical protein EGW08_011558 [Elysia chlorotica]
MAAHIIMYGKYRQELDTLVYTLHTSDEEAQWTSLFNEIEAKWNDTTWHILHVLKSAILDVESVIGLKNFMKLFIMKMSDVITEGSVLEEEISAIECLSLLKDFWALSTTQHHSITKQAFGNFSPTLYDVLPSMASLYIDLFVASNSSKEKTELLSKRLYGWLNMDLNERCLKTALLEVSKVCPKTVAFILPLLKKILSSPPPTMSFMDYLLHFLVLRRWSLVSKDLADLVQVNLNVEAPKGFISWLSERWRNAREHVPQDKSLKGRRVSELMCSLDKEAVEELIDVFSQCLHSGDAHDVESVVPLEDGAAVPDLFVIDKSGSGQDGPPSKKKQKLEESTDFLETSKNSHSKSNNMTVDVKDSAVSYPENNERMMSIHAKTRNKNSNGDNQVTGDISLGFVVDRTAEKERRTVVNGEEEKMEVDENENSESGDDDENSGLESGNEEEEEEEGHDDDDDEDGKKLDKSEEAEAMSDSSSDGNDEDLEEKSDDDNGDDGDDDDDDNMASTDSSKPFPKCVEDPALSYFVKATGSPSKKTSSNTLETLVIDGVEIQTIESSELVLDVKEKRPQAKKVKDGVEPIGRRLRSESESSQGKTSAGASRKKIEIERANQTTTSLPEDSVLESKETDVRAAVTEDQVGFVLSQIRSSLGEGLSGKEQISTAKRYSTRLRTKSESSDVLSDAGSKKSARNGRRQTMTHIKAKAEPSIPSSDNQGSTKILSDWLRKIPAIDELGLSESAQDNSNDNELTVNKTPKTYTSSAKKGSSKRILIESKMENTDVLESELNKSVMKEPKSDSKSPSKDTVSTISSIKKTPKSATLSAKPKDDVEPSKASQATPQSRKTPTGSSKPQRRKYFLRGTSPIKSPTNEKEESVVEGSKDATPKPLTKSSDSHAVQKPKSARKSPAERRKSLRSSKQQ